MDKNVLILSVVVLYGCTPAAAPKPVSMTPSISADQAHELDKGPGPGPDDAARLHESKCPMPMVPLSKIGGPNFSRVSEDVGIGQTLLVCDGFSAVPDGTTKAVARVRVTDQNFALYLVEHGVSTTALACRIRSECGEDCGPECIETKRCCNLIGLIRG